mgnify:CR=1 FL=1
MGLGAIDKSSPHAPMNSHPNSPRTHKSRLRLFNQHLQNQRSIQESACAVHSSWLVRYLLGGAEALADRRSVLYTPWWSLTHIIRLLATPFSKVQRTLKHFVLGRLRNLEPKTHILLYEREHSRSLIKFTLKKLARFREVGPLITGKRWLALHLSVYTE